MKEQKWVEGPEASAELFELPAELIADDAEPDQLTPRSKSNLTELRRRIEERLDSKRIDHEYAWDDFDDLPENVI